MAEAYITKEAQQYSENIISQWLRDSGYDGSLEDGTSLYDVVVRPSGLIYSLFRQNIDRAYAYMSLDKADALRDVLSSEDYDAAIDGIMSNWFVTRNLGGKTTGKIRLYFSRPLDFISFYDGALLGTYNSVQFNVDLDGLSVKAFNAAEFTSVMNTEDNTTEYYIDVPVTSAENAYLIIPSGSVFSVPSPDIYFLRGTAAADFVPGEDSETSDDFVERTKEAITTRELITRRAINTVLPDQFPEIYTLYTAGCGDPEMIRDIKVFQDVPVHVGNKADLWIGSALVRTDETCVVQKDAQGRAYIEPQNKPVHILSIEDDASEYYADESASRIIDESDWSYAMEERDGSDDPLETTWFSPESEIGKIYVTLPGLQDEEYIDPDEVDVTLSYDAKYGIVTEGKAITYKVTLNKALEDDLHITLSDVLQTNSDSVTVLEESRVIVIPAGSVESEAIVVQTREDDVYEQEDDEILLEVLSAEVPGKIFENLQIFNPGSVTVTDGDDYSGGDDDEEEEGGSSEESSETIRTVTVHEITSDVSQNVHAFITNDNNRVASYDPIVKMKVPVVMDFVLNIITNVSYVNGGAEYADLVAQLVDEIQTSVREYVMNTSVYVESELVQHIHADVPSVAVVSLPLTANATFFNMKTGKNVHMSVRDRFSLESVRKPENLSEQITTNTIQYYTNADLITVNLS